MSRLRAAARRLRPTSRRGAVGLAIAGVLGVMALSFLAVGAVIAVPWAYQTYGYHPEANARSWAALEPQYAISATCQGCHATQYAPWTAGHHATVSCGTCHGPLAEHAATAAASPGAVGPSTVSLSMPSTQLCVRCHERVPGRPARFPTVDLAAHYQGASCVGCHDSHAATAVRPPDISHPLDNLPACTTCHKPDGLKPVPEGHVEAPDAVCRTCHQRPSASQ